MESTTVPLTRRTRALPKRYIVVVFAFFFALISLIERVNISIVAPVLGKQYGWSPVVLGTVLSAFFWGYSVSPIPGGWLADRFGGKKVVGWGGIWWSLSTILTPLAGAAASGIMVFRVLLGLGEGVNAPAVQTLLSRWFPLKERTRAVALYLAGSPIGTIIAFPLSTWIVETWGWRAVFYITGALSLVLVALWFALGADSPEKDASIGAEERDYIIDNRGLRETEGGVPWKELLSKGPVWGLVIMTFSVAWMIWLFVAWLPTYLMAAHHYSLKESGFYSALPFVANMFGGIFAGWLQDRLIASGHSITRVRKATLTVSSLLTVVFLLLIPGAPAPIYAVWYLTFAMTVFAASQGTVMVNNIDIAPRHAGVLLGIQATVGNAAGALSPIVAGLIVQRTGNFNGVFYLIAALLIVAVVAWNLLASGEKVID
jgi:MFS transporter, ACS family, solute carrier family 17 (sodium-dependent inorganic phosphate cotransporter), other